VSIVRIVFIVFLFLTAFPALAHLPCLTPKMTEKHVQKAFPGFDVIAAFAGKEAAMFMEKLNQMPPPSNWDADRVVVFGNPDKPMVMITMYRNKCSTGFSWVPVSTLSGLAERI